MASGLQPRWHGQRVAKSTGETDKESRTARWLVPAGLTHVAHISTHALQTLLLLKPSLFCKFGKGVNDNLYIFLEKLNTSKSMQSEHQLAPYLGKLASSLFNAHGIWIFPLGKNSEVLFQKSPRAAQSCPPG